MEKEPGMENMENIKGKNILVTGGTGFVGSHLVKALVKKGATVFVPYRSIDPRSYFYTKKLNNKVVLLSCDLKDRDRVFDIVSKYEITYIFHLAAQAIVPTAYENPVETIESNVMGTTYVLEAARRFSHVKGVIAASSDKSYGKSAKPYVETNPLKGDHPYDVSKASTDLIAQAYAKTYNLPIVITRFGNIYGEGDLNFSRIIPGIMKAIINKETLEIRSNGKFIRDYLYVKDVINGYMLLAQHIEKVKGEAFNFGSKETLSVLEVIELMEKILKKEIKYKILNTAKNEIPYQSLDYTKIHNLLGWKPTNSIQTTAKKILKWYYMNNHP